MAVRFSLHTDSATNLRATLESRTVIDMAIGIVMAQNRCSQEAAVQILTDASSNSNVKLRDIAKSLVDSVGGAGTRTHFEEPGQGQDRGQGRSQAG
jgi:AmiR/NasT family two-component response regulator